MVEVQQNKTGCTCRRSLSSRNCYGRKKTDQKLFGLSAWHVKNIDAIDAKADNSDDFRNTLLNSENSHIVEVTSDRFWGCGLTNIESAMTTHPDFYLGKSTHQSHNNKSIPESESDPDQ